MSIRFEKTAYFSIALEKRNYLNIRFLGDEEFIKYAKHHQNFSIGNVSYKEFSELYSPLNSKKRKMRALPNFFSSVIKAIYHLALAIFIGIPKCFSDKGKFLKAKIFCVIRDFQEAFGHLSFLFNDKFGLYNIQQSQFHKTCYECFTINQGFSTLSCKTRKSLLRYGKDKAKMVSLYEYKTASTNEKNEYIKKYLSSDSVNRLNELMKLDDETLKDLTFVDLLLSFEKSKLKYAIDNEKFDNFKLSDLLEPINIAQIEFIVARSKRCKKSGNNMYVKDLVNFTADEVVQHKDKIPAIGFRFLNKNQLKKLKISDLDKEKANAIFKDNGINEMRKKFATFDSQDIADAINKGILTGWCLQFLDNNVLGKLKLSRLDKEQLKEIFNNSSASSSKQNYDKDVKIFENFTPEDVVEAIKTKKLPKYAYQLISEEQLKSLKISELDPEDISAMFDVFSERSSDERRKRFALFDKNEVHVALQKEKIKGLVLSYITDEQLKDLKLSSLSRETISGLFEDTDSDRLTIFMRLYKGINLFEGYEKNKRRFASFKPADVHEALRKNLLNSYIISLFSVEHIKFKPLSTEEKAKLYKILELEVEASLEQIKSAFRKLALKLHPDKIQRMVGENEETFKQRQKDNEEKFKEINNAQNILCNYLANV